MNYIFEQVRQLGTVALIMVCATVGTVGILKLLK